MKLRIFCTVAMCTLAAPTAQAHDPAPPLTASAPAVTVPDYAGEAQRIADGLHATGMVAAVMVDGNVVYTGALGVEEEGSGRPVTVDTLFPIASISKAFTTTALAILVDRGELDWDDPIRKYIPEFAMYDPWVSEHFTIRDALTHRSGLPLGAGDLLIWPDGDAKADDILRALPHLKPSTGFRDGYAYDNLLYIVAGEVIERVSGKSWASFITDEIFAPVGMTQCAADRSRIAPGRAVVSGHERPAGAVTGKPIDPRTAFSTTWNAAGGIFCTAGDMMVWAKLWFDRGVTADGMRLISEDQARELWKGVTPVGSGRIAESGGSTNLAMYALGWFVRDFEGTPMITHSGGAPGVTSNFILLPQKNIAIFASSNDYMSTPAAWTRQIADVLADGEQDSDVIGGAIAASLEQNKAAKALVANAAAPPKGAAKPTLPLSAYAGVYRDPWYGTVTISETRGKLHIDMSRSEVLDGPLTPFDGDTFAAIWADKTLKADAFVTFTVADGTVTGMTMKAISDITDFSFDFHDLELVRE
ncbi:serine hydrolase [Qipengyuania marisflavi]|uniref:Serine hydrolase n=1 Tax=Qipengyuania marisflavi TaxID=2486356 RepID=A0A5S3P6Z7_9SPHN|nr:serine hydrolase [Qipengyuania marisflavi]TMM48917.1 serine hydrolase [Qipengyuania marisflavi]